MNNEKLKKITFLGDITCDRPLLESSRISKDKYDFRYVFSEMKNYLCQSDYVIANLETVCGGNIDDYKTEFLLYNSPDQLIEAIKESGINFVTTANNHCLDQGIDGLKRTLSLLDKYEIGHSGTYLNQAARNTIKVISIGNLKIAVLSYTYSTNESNTGIILDENNDYLVGILREQFIPIKNQNGMKAFILSHLTAKQKRKVKRIINRSKLLLGMAYFKPYTDIIQPHDTNNKYLEIIKTDIKHAKKVADIVVACPHMGGQFNEMPGEYSDFLCDFLIENGVDIIAGNHPHVIQKAFISKNKVIAYSLGGFNLSISADYIVHECLPEYSMALNVYINEESKKIERVTFSILRIEEDCSHKIVVYPIEKWAENNYSKEFQSEIDKIYNRIMGTQLKNVDIKREYDLRTK